MDLEKIATASVKASISATDVLSPFISEGDKEPSWDGNIYIYSDSNKKKDGIKKVPVQVKGKQNGDFSKEIIKYPISVTDLENYLNDGGVLFFVVYINKTGINTKIYYSCLLPIKIRSLLDNSVRGKKQISIELSPFPEDNWRKVSVLLNFYDHMKKQTSFAHIKLQSLDELERQGVLEGVTFSVTDYGYTDMNPYKLLFQDDIYLYANIKGSAVLQPLEEIPMDMHIAENVKTEVSVNGVPYYSQFQRIRSKDKVVINIGKSVIVSMKEKEQCLTIRFTLTPILKYSVTDLEFILAIQKYSQFEMLGHILPLDSSKMFSMDKVKNLQQNLEYRRKLISLLNIFKLDTEVNMNNFTTEDCRNSQLLIKGLVEHEAVSGLKDDLPFVMRLKYLGKRIIIGLTEAEQPNTYKISDYFSEPLILCYEDEKGTHRTSKYDFLDVDDFLEIRNIEYDDILQSYQELSEEGNIYIRANFLLLKLLLAYDKSGDQRKDILESAHNFAEWLYDANMEEDELEINIRKLNLYQVLKRQNNLTKEQKKELLYIADDLYQNAVIRIGAYLLLDNQMSAEMLFDKLADNVKDEFQKFPIFRYWERNEE